MAQNKPPKRKAPKPRKKKKPKFKLLFDENFSPKPLKKLKRARHNIEYAGSARYRSLEDKEIFNWACEEGRLIITKNTKDFKRFMQMKKASATGILSLSRNLKPPRIDNILTSFLSKKTKDDLYGKITPVPGSR